MTPTATTPTRRAEKSTKSPTPRRAKPTKSGAPPRATGHPQKLRQPPGAARPRRVSGPLGGVTRPRRVAGPARPVARPSASIGARALTFLRALPEHQLLDRLVRGRVWIPLLGVLLAGIVAMQVEVLKLGAGIGRSIERSTQLQSRNELLRASVASLADDQRIESLAAGVGMVMPASDAITFLPVRAPGSVQRAVANIHPPNAAAFTAALPAAGGSAPSSSATGAAPAATGAATATATSSSASSGG